jgi:hypothetical protein
MDRYLEANFPPNRRCRFTTRWRWPLGFGPEETSSAGRHVLPWRYLGWSHTVRSHRPSPGAALSILWSGPTLRWRSAPERRRLNVSYIKSAFELDLPAESEQPRGADGDSVVLRPSSLSIRLP